MRSLHKVDAYSVPLIEKNTKPDTPAGSASCEHHVLVGAIIVERLKV